MSSRVTSVAEHTDTPSPPKRFRITSLEVLCVLLVLAPLGQSWFSRILDVPKIRTGATIFVAVCTQALPFLVVGVLISGAILRTTLHIVRKPADQRGLVVIPPVGRRAHLRWLTAHRRLARDYERTPRSPRP